MPTGTGSMSCHCVTSFLVLVSRLVIRPTNQRSLVLELRNLATKTYRGKSQLGKITYLQRLNYYVYIFSTLWYIMYMLGPD